MPLLGGITQSQGSENSLEIESLAKFAVDEHNSKERVVNTREQVVAGKMYYITLEVTDGGEKKDYEAKVWVKPWENFKQVQEFKYVGDAPSE